MSYRVFSGGDLGAMMEESRKDIRNKWKDIICQLYTLVLHVCKKSITENFLRRVLPGTRKPKNIHNVKESKSNPTLPQMEL